MPEVVNSKVPEAELRIVLLDRFGDFVAPDFSQKYELFVSQLEGIYPLYFTAKAMSVMLPLYSAAGETPYFIVVFHQDKIVAFLPLQLETLGRKPLLYRRLRLWGRVPYYNSSHHSDFMALPEYMEVAPRCVMEFLVKEFDHNLDEMVFDRIKKERPFFNLLDQYFPSGTSFREPEYDHLYFGEIPLAERIKGETRRKIRKANEQLLAAGVPVAFDCVRALNDRLIEEICQLHNDRQHHLVEGGRNRMCFLENEFEKRIFFQQLRYAESVNGLRIYTLRLGEQLVCFLVCVSYGGHTDALLTAFQEIPEQKYMARCLWLFAFEQELNHASVRVIHMGYGTHVLKTTFSTELSLLASVSYRNASRLSSRIKNRIRLLVKKIKNR